MSTDTTFLVRLTRDEREALRSRAEAEHRSMQDIVREAIVERVTQAHQRDRALATLRRVMVRDAELLERLAR